MMSSIPTKLRLELIQATMPVVKIFQLDSGCSQLCSLDSCPLPFISQTASRAIGGIFALIIIPTLIALLFVYYRNFWRKSTTEEVGSSIFSKRIIPTFFQYTELTKENEKDFTETVFVSYDPRERFLPRAKFAAVGGRTEGTGETGGTVGVTEASSWKQGTGIMETIPEIDYPKSINPVDEFEKITPIPYYDDLNEPTGDYIEATMTHKL